MSKNDNSELKNFVGTWRLVSMVAEFQDSNEQTPMPWQGRFILLPDGTYMALLTMKDRAAPTTPEERATALSTVYAESGMASIVDGMLHIAVDLAAHPQLVGSVLHRTSEVDGDRTRSITAWAPSVIRAGRMSRSITEWERE